MNEISGSPLHGRELERLQGFLARHGLSWDEGIEHSVMLLDAGQVVACGSCRANVIECLAVSEERRGEGLLGQVFTHLVGWLVAHGRTQWFCFTKPALRPLVESLGMHCLVATDQVAMLESRKRGLDDYLERVRKETCGQLGEKSGRAGERGADRSSGLAESSGTDERGGADRLSELAGEKGTTVGAIVANCNPLTLGHMHLIETAAAEVDVLHVFVLAAEQDFMPARDRLALVREACAELPNVAVHSGGDYLLSPATFPTYFHKDQAAGLKANCRLDVELFAQRVAPALGITRRFVGTEPTCTVTRQYNECMQEFLPKASIEVVEVPRLEAQVASDGESPTLGTSIKAAEAPRPEARTASDGYNLASGSDIKAAEVSRLKTQGYSGSLKPASEAEPLATQDAANGCKAILASMVRGLAAHSSTPTETGNHISASTVRSLAAQGAWQAIARLVPACTLEYLARRYGWECASDCVDTAGDSSTAAVAGDPENKTR